jgi:hypothetical protein
MTLTNFKLVPVRKAHDVFDDDVDVPFGFDVQIDLLVDEIHDVAKFRREFFGGSLVRGLLSLRARFIDSEALAVPTIQTECSN